jgi:hypothetical protein
MAIILNGTTGPNFDAGQRITGDFSNATVANRVGLQTSTANEGTLVPFLPNGTAVTSGIECYANSDPTNSSLFTFRVSANGLNNNIISGATGTGTFLPINISVGGTARAIFQTNGDFQFNSGYGSVATAYGCRAWVNFNGTGTVAIRASGNVTSITDNGTGQFVINFATAMPDVNYSFAGSAGSATSGVSDASFGILHIKQNTATALQTGSIAVHSGYTDGNSTDYPVNTAAIFR